MEKKTITIFETRIIEKEISFPSYWKDEGILGNKYIYLSHPDFYVKVGYKGSFFDSGKVGNSTLDGFVEITKEEFMEKAIGDLLGIKLMIESVTSELSGI